MANVGVRFRLRSGRSEYWLAKNPILLLGEPGYEEDTKTYKIGDGVSRWSQLPAFIDQVKVQAMINAYLSGGSTAPLETHIASPEPHPAYDDIADLAVVFENGLI